LLQDVKPKAEIAERAVDSEGWEDLLGSGRLRKRVITEGDPEYHPAKGHQVKIRFKGIFQILKLPKPLRLSNDALPFQEAFRTKFSKIANLNFVSRRAK
jgi:hypothetical protein